MRHFLITILLVFLSAQLLGQKPKKNSKKSWDTTFIYVRLQDFVGDKKVVTLDIGQKATIYLNETQIRNGAAARLSNDFIKDDIGKILKFLDSASLVTDTLNMNFPNSFYYFNYLVSEQLKKGNAKVFYKKQKSFVETISHRLEKFGGNGDRFFYLPDKRAFFVVTEITGLIDDDMLSPERHEEYVKEGEKLLSLRQE